MRLLSKRMTSKKKVINKFLTAMAEGEVITSLRAGAMSVDKLVCFCCNLPCLYT